MQVIKKRNGKLVPYNPERILRAIKGANDDLDGKGASASEINVIYKRACDEVKKRWKKDEEVLSVEQINDIVESAMLSVGCTNLMKQFVEYRYLHKLVRQANTTDESILSLIRRSNREVMDENSNKNAQTISTQRDLIAGIVSKDITNRLLLPKEVSDAHNKGWLHFHDMDYAISPMTNCCLVNIEDMLDNGTMMNGKLIESPKSFQVACTIMTQIIASVASSQYGGQSIDICHLGKYLKRSEDKFRKEIDKVCGYAVSEAIKAKLVKERLQKEVESGVQTIQYQINTLFTTNGQSPFVTLFLYLRNNDPYEKYNAMIIEEILKQRKQGIKNSKGIYITPAFPKLIYVLTEDNNLKGGKYDYLTELAAQCNAKRMYPDYISEKVMKENTGGYCFSPMGCRSFLSPWYDKQGNVKFEGRFNQGVVSINLVNVALTAKKQNKDFFDVLEKRLDICYKALMFRHNSLLGTKAKVAPILWQYGAIARLDPEEVIDPLLMGNYSSISLGYIGIYETTLLMTGESQTGENGRKFALKLMQTLKDHCNHWKEETSIGFALYGTPAESLCYRFAKIDEENFGDFLQGQLREDIYGKKYYTNSYHIDVREKINAFAKLKEESQYQKISNGGCISYVELPSMQNNLTAIKSLIKFIYDNVQYGEFNLKSDYCQNCGFDGEMLIDDNGEWYCPNCGNRDHNTLNVVRRTCGYLGENWFNSGKTREIKSRVTHL